MRQYVKIFKALSDANRLRILNMLQVRPLCVCEMQSVLKLAPSTVSKHLSILRDAGFIYDVKENKWVNYYIDSETSNEMIKSLLDLIDQNIPSVEQIANDSKLVAKVDRNQLCQISDKGNKS